MANFLLILVCLLGGYTLRKTNTLSESASANLNAFVVYVSLPALILVHIPVLVTTTSWTWQLLIPASMPWIHFLIGAALFLFLGRLFQWTKATTGALVLTAGLGNTSFVGFPLLESFLGRPGVQVGVIVDQLGSFLTLSTLGIFTAASFAGRDFSISKASMRILGFPPFIALIISVLWALSGNFSEGIFFQVCERLAQTLVPLAVFSVGLRLKVSPSLFQRRYKEFTLGICFKLLIAPALLAGLYFLLGADPSSILYRATIIEAAMPPMITAAIVAAQYDLDTEIADLMVGAGIPLCLGTTLLWHSTLLRFVV